MLHTTDHDWPRTLSSAPSGRFRRASLGLVALMLLGVAAQHAAAGQHGGGGTQLRLDKINDLVFGRYATTQSQGGTVTINPATGGKTVTGPLFDFGTAHQRAQFHATGDPDAAFSITLPSQINIAKGGDTMIVSPVTSSPSGSGVLDGTGSAEIYVGGTLTLSGNQADGNYSKLFSVTVNYQ